MVVGSHELVGRLVERERLAGLLRGAREGVSGVLMLEGKPGVGKTALLDWAVDSANGFRELRSSGVESEIELPYGALAKLLHSLTDFVPRLTGTDTETLRAVSAATGIRLTQGEPAHRGGPLEQFAVGAAALSLIAAAAESEPVLAVVDDAHWIDQPSAEALVFITRRLLADNVVLLFSRRTAEGVSVLDRMPSMPVAGLDEVAATELLTRQGAGTLPAEHIKRLLAMSEGNPLALAELPRLLKPDQLYGRAPIGPSLPIGGVLLEAYSAEMQRFSERTRRAILVVALHEATDIRSVERAFEEAGLELADLEPAEDAGLLTIVEAGVSFRHPLIRSAATFSAPTSWRRRAHAALASSMRDVAQPNQRLQRCWHLAAATPGSDESVAMLLEEVADQAILLSGFAAGCTAYERAAQLSTDQQARNRRLARAADAALNSGLTGKADQLLEMNEATATDDLTTWMSVVEIKSRVDIATGQLEAALIGAVTAADQIVEPHPLEAAQLLLAAVTATAFLGDTEASLRYASRAQELSRDDMLTTGVAEAAVGSVLTVRGDSDRGLSLVLPVVEFLSPLIASDPQVLEPVTRIGLSLVVSDHFDVADRVYRAVIEKAHQSGAVSALPLALTCLSVIDLKRGEWTAALATAHRAVSLAEEVDQRFQKGNALGQLAAVQACLGDEVACRQSVATTLEITAQIGAAPIEALAHYHLGLLELSLRRLSPAVDSLERAKAICQRCGLMELGHFQWASELIEVYLRLGQHEPARAILQQLELHAQHTNRPIIKALAARCRGLLEDDFEQHFERALRWHAESERPFELSRTRLCYGERLRRDRRKRDAREQLEAAWTEFRALGAAAWAELARVELAAVGVTIDEQARNSKAARLTPQELQVALSAASGLSNREAAGQLFLSPKTIEYHLSRVFRKLDVTSRSQLADALQGT